VYDPLAQTFVIDGLALVDESIGTGALECDFSFPLRTEAELRRFLALSFDVYIPDVHVCPNHSTPWRAFADAYFARSPVSIWKASRGLGGKSYLLALLGLTEAITLGADVNVLGGSGEQSERVHEYMADFWSSPYAPRQFLSTDPGRRETRMLSGAKIKALMASSRSVRGPHPQRLRLDEIDEIDLAIFDAAMGQPMNAYKGEGAKRHLIRAQTVGSSTHQYADGTMTKILLRAADKGWPVHEWCYRESHALGFGWLSAMQIAQKRSEVTQVMWDVEYDLQEPAPGTRAISTPAVKRSFLRSLRVVDGTPGELYMFEPPERGAQYATGADWARKTDWTVIVTFRTDCRPMRCVAWERMQRLPWPQIIQRYNARLAMYGRRSAHDATGLGDVVASYLTGGALQEDVLMTGRTRSDMLTEYIAGMENGEIAYPMIKFAEAEHRLASVDDVYKSGTTTHLPDSIAAGALAYRAGKVPVAASGESKVNPQAVRAQRRSRLWNQ